MSKIRKTFHPIVQEMNSSSINLLSRSPSPAKDKKMDTKGAGVTVRNKKTIRAPKKPPPGPAGAAAAGINNLGKSGAVGGGGKKSLQKDLDSDDDWTPVQPLKGKKGYPAPQQQQKAPQPQGQGPAKRKAKPLPPIEEDRTFTPSDQEDEEEEEESFGAGVQLNMILTKLGSELQHRMKAKRKRLQDCFLSVKGAPNKILETLASQTTERNKVIESFQKKTSDVVEQVNQVLVLQKQAEEKLSKMVLFIQKHFDSVKDSLKGSLTGLGEAVKQFEQDIDSMEDRHDEDSKKQLDAIQAELALLQRKILQEGQQEETESIRNTLHLV